MFLTTDKTFKIKIYQFFSFIHIIILSLIEKRGNFLRLHKFHMLGMS